VRLPLPTVRLHASYHLTSSFVKSIAKAKAQRYCLSVY
jgi:hypothetical protein